MARVKLLLNESIKNVGRVGDVVEVSPGYARNYLLPKGLAIEPTPANIRRVEERRKEIERMERERREQQESLIKQVEGTEITLERRTNEQGHLFGSVSATDIARTLQALGFNIHPDDINLPGRLDHVDAYTVQVKFAEDLAADVKVWVAPDAESKAAIEAAQKAAAEQAAATDGQTQSE
jgi:large subunit ribosomal protein L9